MENFSVLLLFFLFLFTSCSFPKTSSGGMTDVSAEYLTNLYTEIACELPDTARINHKVLPYYEQDMARDAALSAGKIALDGYGLQYYNYDAFSALLSGEFYPIGYASATDSGARIGTDQAYVVTALSENPNTCFDIIISFFIGTHRNRRDQKEKSGGNIAALCTEAAVPPGNDFLYNSGNGCPVRRRNQISV